MAPPIYNPRDGMSDFRTEIDPEAWPHQLSRIHDTVYGRGGLLERVSDAREARKDLEVKMQDLLVAEVELLQIEISRLRKQVAIYSVLFSTLVLGWSVCWTVCVVTYALWYVGAK